MGFFTAKTPFFREKRPNGPLCGVVFRPIGVITIIVKMGILLLLFLKNVFILRLYTPI